MRYGSKVFWGVLLMAAAVRAQNTAAPVCQANPPFATFAIPHVKGEPELSVDPHNAIWKRAAKQQIVKDCSREVSYGKLESAVLSFWTDKSIYFLFQCPYEELNLFLPADHTKPRSGLWDRDVVEMFLGYDWQNIRHYREFEIAPTGDWIDLAIDLDHESYDKSWRSGWKTDATIDKKRKVWYAAARIPLMAITAEPVQTGTKWRMNLYRIEGLGADPQRHFMCWQPTCVQNRDPNHVPEHFGTLLFDRAH
jgi:hypothetical protein